ncbi:MAG TPA: hypothetical protein VFQ30_15500, partial [Ktedonobacteraceae bacterium]|nr:hypothetical protein [Ktedonobacteraceae bacterium]
MLEKIKAAYTNYRSLRLAACAGLLACAILLYWLSGGFPPPAWRFLFQSLPRIPLLWQSQGVAFLLPLAGLLCLALTLFVLWVVVIAACIKMARYWWNDFLERRHFVEELQEAEQLAEQMAMEEMQQGAATTGTTGVPGAIGNRAEPAAYIPQTPQPALVMQEAGRPVEARGRSATAVSPESRIMQPFERVEWQAPQVAPALPVAQSVSTAVAAPPAPPASPALARGQLRLVPRPDEEDDWENREDGDDEDEDTDEIPEIARTPMREPPGLEVGAGLHPGFHRKDAPNEDALFEIQGTHTTPAGLQHIGLFVVADGA